jgi:hypothetical protein
MKTRFVFTVLLFGWGILPFASDFCGTGGGSCPCDMPEVYDYRILSMRAHLYDANFTEAKPTIWYAKDSLSVYFGVDETETVYAASAPTGGSYLYACSPVEPMATNGILGFALHASEALWINGDWLAAGANLNSYFHFGNSRGYGRSYSDFFSSAYQQTIEPRFEAWWKNEIYDSLEVKLSADFYFNDSTQSRVENICLKLKP